MNIMINQGLDYYDSPGKRKGFYESLGERIDYIEAESGIEMKLKKNLRELTSILSGNADYNGKKLRKWRDKADPAFRKMQEIKDLVCEYDIEGRIKNIFLGEFNSLLRHSITGNRYLKRIKDKDFSETLILSAEGYISDMNSFIKKSGNNENSDYSEGKIADKQYDIVLSDVFRKPVKYSKPNYLGTKLKRSIGIIGAMVLGGFLFFGSSCRDKNNYASAENSRQLLSFRTEDYAKREELKELERKVITIEVNTLNYDANLKQLNERTAELQSSNESHKTNFTNLESRIAGIGKEIEEINKENKNELNSFKEELSRQYKESIESLKNDINKTIKDELSQYSSKIDEKLSITEKAPETAIVEDEVKPMPVKDIDEHEKRLKESIYTIAASFRYPGFPWGRAIYNEKRETFENITEVSLSYGYDAGLIDTKDELREIAEGISKIYNPAYIDSGAFEKMGQSLGINPGIIKEIEGNAGNPTDYDKMAQLLGKFSINQIAIYVDENGKIQFLSSLDDLIKVKGGQL